MRNITCLIWKKNHTYFGQETAIVHTDADTEVIWKCCQWKNKWRKKFSRPLRYAVSLKQLRLNSNLFSRFSEYIIKKVFYLTTVLLMTF